jgi:ParB/RepB/Spo0J family partition protein
MQESQQCSLREVDAMTIQMSGRPSEAPDRFAATRRRPLPRKPKVQKIAVARIRAEEGLGRKRDRQGHRELRRSIEQFGVLTPITVRRAHDGSGDYLLVKGQGRTLACQMLGVKTIPAIVVGENFAEDEKVQQFLVENVARLRMRPIDRALLIARARQQGEETADVARRFGVTASTVRRLEAQLDGATKHEVAALGTGTVNLTLHAVLARHVAPEERGDVVDIVAKYKLRTKEVETLFRAFGWGDLVALGSQYRTGRLLLLAWACRELSNMQAGPLDGRFLRLAESLPIALGANTVTHQPSVAR